MYSWIEGGISLSGATIQLKRMQTWFLKEIIKREGIQKLKKKLS